MFEKWEKAQYRSADSTALNERKIAIADELENADSELSFDELKAERDMCMDAIERRSAVDALRATPKVVERQAYNGDTAVKTWAKAEGAEKRSGTFEVVNEDVFATEGYHRAFADFITRGKAMPAEYENAIQNRAAAYTTVTTDAGKVVPTQLMDTILSTQEQRGDILSRVTKTSYAGGINIPVADFNATASWITEAKTSDDQKLTGIDYITFGYNGLEVKLAQSFLAAGLTLGSFEAKFAETAANAMVDAKEQGILNGSGSGQMLGILNDTRVKADQKVAMKAADFTWAGWHKLVKAKMKPAYRDGEFIFAQSTWDSLIDGMVDANGQPVARVTYGVNGEEVYRFMGKNVLIVEDKLLPDYDSATAGKAFGLFIKLANYTINSALPMTITRWNDEDKNLQKLKMLEYLDGKLVDTNGVLVLTKATA